MINTSLREEEKERKPSVSGFLTSVLVLILSETVTAVTFILAEDLTQNRFNVSQKTTFESHKRIW